MNYCQNCGSNLEPEMKFCGNCGKPILGVLEPVGLSDREKSLSSPSTTPKNSLLANKERKKKIFVISLLTLFCITYIVFSYLVTRQDNVVSESVIALFDAPKEKVIQQMGSPDKVEADGTTITYEDKSQIQFSFKDGKVYLISVTIPGYDSQDVEEKYLRADEEFVRRGYIQEANIVGTCQVFHNAQTQVLINHGFDSGKWTLYIMIQHRLW